MPYELFVFIVLLLIAAPLSLSKNEHLQKVALFIFLLMGAIATVGIFVIVSNLP